MLAVKYRIRKKREIEKIFQNNSSFFSKILGVKTIENNYQYPRFVILVSNKISKKAVERNKIKRRIRAAVYYLLPKIKKNKDCAIITLKPIINADFSEIKKTLEEAFKKQRLI